MKGLAGFFVAVALSVAVLGCGGTGVTSTSGNTDHLYIADGNDRIVRISDMAGGGWTTFGSSGSGVNQFSFPADIAFDSIGRMYVADYDNNRIVRVNNMTGAGWVTYGTGGSGSGQFNHPYRLALDSQDRIYIVDADNFRIVRIDDMSGTNWVAYGSQGNGIGQFNAPQGIGIDSLDRIYITDYVNDRIARFTNMSGAGWTTFGTSGSGVGQFNAPDDIVFDNSGHMIVSDRSGRIIQTSLMSQTGWIELPLAVVQSICLDSSHRIYAVDQSADRLTRFNGINGGGTLTFGTSGSGINQFINPSSVRFGP